MESGNRSNVLVVDDDEAVRLRVRDLLEHGGLCSVDEAPSGQACLDSVSRRLPDLILLDCMMPGMNGLDVCSHLRSDPRTREIPIIMVSAADAETARTAALGAGAEDFITKPIPARELVAKVDTIIRLDRLRSLRRERDRMSWLFENAVEPMLRVTRDGRLREANSRAREIFGLSSTSTGPVSGDAPDVFELIARRHRADPPDSLALLRAGLPVPGGRFSLCRPESSLVSARWYLVDAHQDQDSPAADLLLRFSEHTERVRLELESRTFQSIISHKLRTPLNGVGSMLDFLLDEPGHLAGAEARELALSARECARRLEGTLLSIMRYHAAICGSTVSTVSAAPGAPRSWSELLLEAAAEAGVPRGRLFLAGDPPPVLAPALVGPMRIVLGELAGNYLKFADVAQGGLEARFESPAGAPARLRLFSPGPALAPELVARLGRPYWQIEKSFTGEVPGMGLGLATCRLLLASLGAELAFSASDHPPGLISLVILPSLS